MYQSVPEVSSTIRMTISSQKLHANLMLMKTSESFFRAVRIAVKRPNILDGSHLHVFAMGVLNTIGYPMLVITTYNVSCAYVIYHLGECERPENSRNEELLIALMSIVNMFMIPIIQRVYTEVQEFLGDKVLGEDTALEAFFTDVMWLSEKVLKDLPLRYSNTVALRSRTNRDFSNIFESTTTKILTSCTYTSLIKQVTNVQLSILKPRIRDKIASCMEKPNLRFNKDLVVSFSNLNLVLNLFFCDVDRYGPNADNICCLQNIDGVDKFYEKIYKELHKEL